MYLFFNLINNVLIRLFLNPIPSMSDVEFSEEVEVVGHDSINHHFVFSSFVAIKSLLSGCLLLLLITYSTRHFRDSIQMGQIIKNENTRYKKISHAYLECDSNRLTLDPGVLWKNFRQKERADL